MPVPIPPLNIDGSHPALRSLHFDMGQGIVAFCFQDQRYPRLAPQMHEKIGYMIVRLSYCTGIAEYDATADEVLHSSAQECATLSPREQRAHVVEP
jgi:hypothetical protein